MKADETVFKKILIEGNYVTAEDIEKGEKYSKSHHTSILEYLISKNILTKDLIGQAMAEYYGVPYADLNSLPASLERINKIPEEVAKKYRAVLFNESEDALIVTTDHPDNTALPAELKKLFPAKTVVLNYSLGEDLDATFVNYQKPLDTRFSKIIEESKRVAPEIIDELFEDALVYKASDIHFEPLKEVVVIRFRVDGVLHEAGRIPIQYYENILNRIKVQSNLRIDEHLSAQDGSLRHEKEGSAVDMRVSIVPTIRGEKVVLRVLATYTQGLSLADLGLSSAHQELFETAAKKPFGMILVTGPTGSGKTTTLYSLLKLTNSPEINITTIEDPVEYRIEGINQIQVNPRTELTFAKGLRSIVRQDPDTILVGEIRDNETAEIAVNAALTGHLLFSTFHANNASTTVPRLLDMGIEPFLLASTLEVIVAQRLVRKICDFCRHSVKKTSSDFNTPLLKEAKKYLPGESITLYEGKGCESCGNTGYKGRTAIFEFIEITQEMQELISDTPSAQDIWKLAEKDGSKSLFEDGIEKVKTGVTTIEELLRVAEPTSQ